MDLNAVIFDLDGVICSTDRFHFLAWKELAGQLGLPFSEALNDRLRGVGRAESLELILAGCPRSFTPAQKAAMCEQKNLRYRQLLCQMSPADLSGEARSALLALRRVGLLLAVGSSSRNAPFILERIGLGGFFQVVADGSQITRSKPDPEVFLLAAKRLGQAPQRCLVVEDAAAGIQAAKAGGFWAAGLGAAASCPGVDFPLRSLAQLPALCAANR